MADLSMPVAEPRTPEPTYAISASSRSPWMVPASPKVPWRTGKMMSRDCAREAPCPVMSALALSWMDFDFDVLSRTGAGFVSPARRSSASVEVSHWPCLVMAMGMTSYLARSMALRMEFAERRETSCSPERPPKRIPTRNFFFSGFFVMDRYKFLAVSGCGVEQKKIERQKGNFAGGFADCGWFSGGKSWSICG